jgi:hypothetical protein
MTMLRSRRIEAFETAMSEAARHSATGNATMALAALERAHVLGQRDVVPHLRVHWRMLRVGWSAGDRREVRGQLMRIALVPVGHLFRRLPVGNTGRANVNAFQPMPIPPEIERLLKDRDR